MLRIRRRQFFQIVKTRLAPLDSRIETSSWENNQSNAEEFEKVRFRKLKVQDLTVLDER
jgi:hypothetical protein